MTNYFENCKTEKEIKETYKNLVKKYHPDIYGEKGNEILKDIHNQLEKALKNAGKDFYNSEIKEDSTEVRAKKEELAKVVEQYGAFAYQHLFVAYWQNGLRPCNHINPKTKHNFSGWNVWQLELKMLQAGYKTSEWSTFAQYREDNEVIRKGEKATNITLAIVTKDKENEENTKIFYKAYNVFNKEQIKTSEEEVKQIAEVKQIGTNKKEVEQLNLWQAKYQTIA